MRPQYPEARLYLEGLEAAGPAGFAPIGWLYSGIMEDLVGKGLAVQAGPGGAYVLSKLGSEELQRIRADAHTALAEQHIEALHDLIRSAAPLGWAATGDTARASEWEKAATLLMAQWFEPRGAG